MAGPNSATLILWSPNTSNVLYKAASVLFMVDTRLLTDERSGGTNVSSVVEAGLFERSVETTSVGFMGEDGREGRGVTRLIDMRTGFG